MTDESTTDVLLFGCPECGGDHGEAPHDPQCMTGQLEAMENASKRLRRCIANNSRPPYDEVAALLCKRMRACVMQLETRAGYERAAAVCPFLTADGS